ncbi:MAG: hypothetical protein AB7N76_31855 [Planctomycetota bacterium]
MSSRRPPSPSPRPVAAALLALLVPLGPLLGSILGWARPARAQGAGGVAPLASYVVDTRRRTLRGLPLKRVIVDATGWRRVTADLEGAPPAPDFAKGQVCLLVVADASGGAKTWVERLTRISSDRLRVSLARVDANVDLNPHLRCFFFFLPAFAGGVELQHRSIMPEGGGAMSVRFKPDPTDRDPRRLPELGPDLRLSYALPVGVKLTDGALKLRYEARYTGGVPGKLATVEFPASGLPFPRIRHGTGALHIYAAHTNELRSKNALAIDRLPPEGPDGSPQVVRHCFQLEPIPGGR